MRLCHPASQPAAVWLNLDEDAMTLEILEGLRAFHVGWFAAYWPRPARRGIGQSTAELFGRALAWLGAGSERIRWARQVLRALPPEWPRPLQDDAAIRARQLLLGVEGNFDARSTTAIAAPCGASRPAAMATVRR